MDGSRKAIVWRERLRRHERAELTVAAFCQQEGVSVPSFYQWRKRLAGPQARRSTRRERRQTPAFQQVMLAGGNVMVIELPSGVRMELPSQHVPFARAVVAELLQAESSRGRGDV